MQDDEISSKSAEVESLKEQVADQDDLLLAAKRDCDSLQAEIARIQTGNDSAKVPYCIRLTTFCLQCSYHILHALS